MASVVINEQECAHCKKNKHEKCNGFAKWDDKNPRVTVAYYCTCTQGSHTDRPSALVMDLDKMLDNAKLKEAKKAAPSVIVNKRAEILRTAEDLINGDRAKTYGAPEISFGRIADIWNASGYRHHVQVPDQPIGVTKANKLDAVDAALILIGMKLSRTIGGRQQMDNWIDMAGYSGLGAELASS